MLNKKSKISVIAAVLATLSVASWFFFGAKKERKSTENLDYSPMIFKEESAEKTKTDEESSSLSSQNNKYENVKYGFSFNYPDGFTVSEFVEEGGKIVLTAQNAKTGQGLQIYITAYDDPNFLVSKESILRDVPDMPVLNSADVVVDGKAKGAAFFSENESFGKTAEVWFADGRNFYQATAYRKDVKILEEIIKSWEFRN